MRFNPSADFDFSRRAGRVRFDPVAGDVICSQSPNLTLGISPDTAMLWLDASTITGADGDLKTSWTDGGVGGNNLVTGNGAILKTGVNGKNGRNVLDFNGTTHWLNKLSGISMPTGNNAWTVFEVVNFVGTPGGYSPFSFKWGGNGTSGNVRFQHGQSASTGVLKANFATAQLIYSGFGAASGNNWYVRVTHYIGGTNIDDAYMRFNGVELISTRDHTAPNIGSSSIWVGYNGDGGIGAVFKGQIAEIVVYGTHIGAAGIASEEARLNAKWGIY